MDQVWTRFCKMHLVSAVKGPRLRLEGIDNLLGIFLQFVTNKCINLSVRKNTFKFLANFWPFLALFDHFGPLCVSIKRVKVEARGHRQSLGLLCPICGQQMHKSHGKKNSFFFWPIGDHFQVVHWNLFYLIWL
jgi:hypothetical protein